MVNLEEYPKIIQSVLEHYANIPFHYGTVKNSVVIDQNQEHFMLIISGWEEKKRIHGCITHVQIIDDKIWIQRDGIEDGITDELVAAGIPKTQIVLAFHPPNIRPHTGYAVC